MYVTVLVTVAARQKNIKPANIGDNINLTREDQVKNKLRNYNLIE